MNKHQTRLCKRDRFSISNTQTTRASYVVVLDKFKNILGTIPGTRVESQIYTHTKSFVHLNVTIVAL